MSGPGSSSLNAARRARELDELAHGEVVDLLVVGGGITGAGVALDAAGRGLSVALVEKHDLAYGTSRWSSKLIHGGLRYLASGDVRIAVECAVERGILLERTAPHLVRPLPMILPLRDGADRRATAVARLGIRAADALRMAAGTSRATLPAPRRLSRVETLRMVPALRRAGLRGSLLAWDGQVEDDARLVVAVARTAASHGARILTRCAAEALDGGGAKLRDVLSGEAFRVRARAVVNAAGVWAGGLAPGVRLRPSRGTHIVVSRRRLRGLGAHVFVPVPGERNRFVFATPQQLGRVTVGLTDEAVEGPLPDVPAAGEGEIAFLLDVVGSVLEVPLRPADVLGAFAGLRPLLETGATGAAAPRTADLSRRHAVLVSDGGIVTVVGGKLTTYRRMAEDAVDAAVRLRGLRAGPCRTRRDALVGAAPRDRLDAVRAPRDLVDRHGTEAPHVLAQAGGDPAFLAEVAPGLGVTAAELVYAIRHEGALDADDLLDRRTRIGLVPADRERALATARRLCADASPGTAAPAAPARVATPAH